MEGPGQPPACMEPRATGAPAAAGVVRAPPAPRSIYGTPVSRPSSPGPRPTLRRQPPCPHPPNPRRRPGQRLLHPACHPSAASM